MSAKGIRRVLAALMSAVMAFSVGGRYIPTGGIAALAAEAEENYTYDSYTAEYDITSASVTISSAGTYRVYGNSTSTSNTIKVSSSEDVAVVLDNVVISSSSSSIAISGTGKTTLVLIGTNSLTSSGNPGIFKDTSSGELIIAAYGNDNSEGSLTAKSNNYYSAGIGGYWGDTGSITINSGTITATGGNYSAGIGGGYKGSGSNITINGGTVTASGGSYGAGIGGGDDGSGSNITINGGVVTASSSSNGAGIGGGRSGSGSNITISGGTVTASSAGYGAGIGGGYSSSGSNIKIYNSSVKASSISVTPTNADGERGCEKIEFSIFHSPLIITNYCYLF